MSSTRSVSSLLRSNLREALLFALGAAGFIHEVFWMSHERPFLIAASLALMGLPFVLSGDSLVQRKSEEQKREERRRKLESELEKLRRQDGT